MDKELRDRLLAMPGEYRRETEHIIKCHHTLGKTRQSVEAMKTRVASEKAKLWAAETRTNEQTRNAQLAEALLFDDSYQARLSQCQALEDGIKAAQLRIECLRFESAVLIAVVSTDVSLTLHDGRVTLSHAE